MVINMNNVVKLERNMKKPTVRAYYENYDLDEVMRIDHRISRIETYLDLASDDEISFEKKVRDIIRTPLRLNIDSVDFDVSNVRRQDGECVTNPSEGRYQTDLTDYVAYFGGMFLSILLCLYSIFFGRLEYVLPSFASFVMVFLLMRRVRDD